MISVEVSIDQLNYILSVLVEKPYGEVVDLVQTLQQQGQAQFEALNSGDDE